MKQSIKQSIKSLLVFGLALTVQFGIAQDETTAQGEKTERAAKAKKHSYVKHLSKDELQNLRSQIEEIKKDNTLTPEEKSSKIKSVRKEFNVDRKLTKQERREIKKHKKKGKGQESKKGKMSVEYKDAMKAEKQKLKAKIQSIKADENLNKDEKNQQIDELKSAYHGVKTASKKTQKAGKGRMLKANQVEKITINPERAKKALKQLDKSESNFNKQLKKGKITEAEYSNKINQINQLRTQLTGL